MLVVVAGKITEGQEGEPDLKVVTLLLSIVWTKLTFISGCVFDDSRKQQDEERHTLLSPKTLLSRTLFA